MATKSYWYVREHVGRGLFHLVDSDVRGIWQQEPAVRALCGKEIASEDERWDTQYEGDMTGWPTCSTCFTRAE